MDSVSLGPSSSLGCGWRKWPRDKDGSCLEADSQKGVASRMEVSRGEDESMTGFSERKLDLVGGRAIAQAG